MEIEHYSEVAFRKYGDMVYRLAFARTRNAADAEDIVGEVFLRYLRKGERVCPEEHERALLIRITVNCSNTLLGTAWRRHTVALSESEATATLPQNDTLEAVLKLPMKYRTAIHLHYYEGYSVEEIAALLKTKPATVKSWLHRGREKLRGLLEGVEF